MPPDVIQLTTESSRPSIPSCLSAGNIENIGLSKDALMAVEADVLKIDQRRAYDIITWHLDRTLEDRDPPPLRMILYHPIMYQIWECDQATNFDIIGMSTGQPMSAHIDFSAIDPWANIG
ncbi:hypothetical protein PAXINDRAFT_18887 [Paxillus involutus ATCC 200175]|uniref:Uncharacterized protein n=1 Tax=Paxillus involutus ATCC 200175 TaxID=664439 RepID=A0A0C9TA18_PAXIN|nr:hypothetical protein PAXINDRAFT_18887 [Paxillus involutus ATCC 200175]